MKSTPKQRGSPQSSETDDRVQWFHEAEAFITTKDYKDNFSNFPAFSLINPSKSEIGKISKSVLDRINNALVENTNVNQLKNRTNTKQSFKIIPNQKLSSFVKFDIGNFYPSISE